MLYKAVDVWKRTEKGLIRYRCFETIPGHQFCVQSADFYVNSGSGNKNGEWLDRQFVDLLAEQAPNERSGTFPTLEEAIAATTQFRELLSKRCMK